MKILHICSAHLPDFDAGRGGPVYYRQTAEALAKLGHEVHVRVLNGKVSKRRTCASDPWMSFEVLQPYTERSRGDRWGAMLDGPRRADIIAPGYLQYGPHLIQLVEQEDFDVVVCDWIGSLVAVPRNLAVPILYIQHDFAHEIERVKRNHQRRKLDPRSLLSLSRLQDIELGQIQRAKSVICASNSEAARVEELTGIPTFYVPIYGGPIPAPKAPVSTSPRVFVFGFHNTAMSSSLTNVKELFNALKRWGQPSLHHVGTLNDKGLAAWKDVQDEHKITFHGYVADLTTVFRPGDIMIAPYSEGTGFRTKFVTASAHGLICAGLDRSFDCAPEFQDGETCVTAPDLPRLAERIFDLLRDRDERQRLSTRARALYEQEFNIERHLPSYRAALDRTVVDTAALAS
ncbi:MAG: glycosyltransferase family 4 protein [Pseudomonadota bacterium]